MTNQWLGHCMIAHQQLRPRLWPSFRRQPQAPPEPATGHVQPQPTQPLAEETHHAPSRWALAPARGGGRWPLQTSRRHAVPVGLLDAGAIGQYPEHRHGQHQPVPGATDGLRAPRLLPLPAHAFEGPEPQFDLHPQPIPTDAYAFRGHVRQDHPRARLVRGLHHHQCPHAADRPVRERHATPDPSVAGPGYQLARRAAPLAQGLKAHRLLHP
jgi:hypothetical protein